MKKLIQIFAICLMVLTIGAAAPAVDVYVMIYDSGTFGEKPAVVEVKLKHHTIECEVDMCPSEDLEVVGEAFDRKGNFLGLRKVTLKKGYLNNEKNWLYNHPNHKTIKGNNIWLWDV